MQELCIEMQTLVSAVHRCDRHSCRALCRSSRKNLELRFFLHSGAAIVFTHVGDTRAASLLEVRWATLKPRTRAMPKQLENADSGNCRRLQTLEIGDFGECRIRKMQNLENADSGKCKIWRMQILEIAEDLCGHSPEPAAALAPAPTLLTWIPSCVSRNRSAQTRAGQGWTLPGTATSQPSVRYPR